MCFKTNAENDCIESGAVRMQDTIDTLEPMEPIPTSSDMLPRTEARRWVGEDSPAMIRHSMSETDHSPPMKKP